MMSALTHKKAPILATAFFSVLFLLLFALIPGAKISASALDYTAPCTGKTIQYRYSSSDYTITSSSYVEITSSSQYCNIKVKPNTSTASRTIILYVKDRNKSTVDTLMIRQSGVPTRYLTAEHTGGNLAFTYTDAYSYAYSNTAVCSSRSGNSFVVKPNTVTTARKCTVTVKNRAGNTICYVYITQKAIPVYSKNIAGGGESFKRSYSSTASFSPNIANMVSVSSSAPSGGVYTYTLSFCANPSSSASRTVTIPVKNSAGVCLEIIKVTQSKFVAPSKTVTISSDPQTVTYSFSGAVSSITYSNKAMFGSYKKSGNNYQFSVSQNTTANSRSNKVTFKDRNGTPIAVYTVTQKGVPLVKKTASKGTAWLIFYSSDYDIAYFSYDKSQVSKITALNYGDFSIEITANPSVTANRTFDIIGKKSNGVYAEIIRITQPPHTHDYKYTATTSHVLTRKCKHCSDHDDDIPYQQFLTYQGRSDNEMSVKSFMQACGYALNGTETRNMVAAYQYLHKNNNRNWYTASKMSMLQGGLQDWKAFADTVSIIANDKVLTKGLNVLSTANHLYGFFSAKDTAGKFSNAVKLAGDFFAAKLDDYSGGYLSSALDTVGTALSNTIPKVISKQDRDLRAALYAYDLVHNDYIANLSVDQLTNNATVRNAINDLFNGKFPKYTQGCAEKLRTWKVAYAIQADLNQRITALGSTPTVPTYDFWTYVFYYTDR